MYSYAYEVNGVFVIKGKRLREVLFDGEIRLSDEVFESFETPCKLENNIFVPCEMPLTEEQDENEELDEVLESVE